MPIRKTSTHAAQQADDCGTIKTVSDVSVETGMNSRVRKYKRENKRERERDHPPQLGCCSKMKKRRKYHVNRSHRTVMINFDKFDDFKSIDHNTDTATQCRSTRENG